MGTKVGASRYSLIIETSKDKYYFDTKIGTFVKMYETESKKCSIQALDFLTSNFSDKNELAKSYGIEDEVIRTYITYQFKGEKLLAPVFNNNAWAYVAATSNGAEVNFKDERNLELFNEVYGEIADLDSEFSNELLKNKKRLINLSPKTTGTIISLRAHENAYRMKRNFGFPVNGYETFQKVDSIYSEDRYGFYQDLKKYLTKYREFRTVYLNYCKFTKKQENIVSEEKPKKKVLVPPEQLSFLDNNI